MPYKAYRWCFVRECRNSSIKTPEKLFFPVPCNPNVRSKWYESAQRLGKPSSGNMFCCQDHFNIKEDMENYVKFSLTGKPIKIKQGIVPHIFDCRKSPRTKKTPAPRAAFIKLNRKRAVSEILSSYEDKHENKFFKIKKENSEDIHQYDCGESPKPHILLFKTEQELDASTSACEFPMTIDQLDIKTKWDSNEQIFSPVEVYIKEETNWEAEYVDTDPLNIDEVHTKRLIVQYEKVVTSETEDIPQKSLLTNQPIIKTEIDVDYGIFRSTESNEEKLPKLVPLSSIAKPENGTIPKTADVTHKSILTNQPEIPLPKLIPLVRNTKESPRKLKHVCNVCGKSFQYPHKLSLHKVVHTGEKPHVCHVCNKSFNNISNFMKHKLHHTGEKSYVCDVCNKTFARPSDLNRHKITHTGAKHHCCNICGKAFSSVSNLTTHKLIHYNERPYACDICNKTFNKKGTLVTHKMIHNNERPRFKCDVCCKTFTHEKSFQNHKRFHVSEKPNESEEKIPNLHYC